MLDVIKFCDKINQNLAEGLKKTKRELNRQLNDNERKEIISELQMNDELNKKHLPYNNNNNMKQLALNVLRN